VDQPTVEGVVRLTARLSAAAFAAAVMLFALGYPHDRRRAHVATRLFAGFIGAHTIHFAAVAWLAVLTSGENIRERDGWAAVTVVGALFYGAAFVVLREWSAVVSGPLPLRRMRGIATVALAAIAAAFLNSYLARVAFMPWYWLPTIGMAGILATYLARTRAVAARDALRPARDL
jgi:hypothetical protein